MMKCKRRSFYIASLSPIVLTTLRPELLLTVVKICYNFMFQVLGNHEFDNDIEGVVPYLKALNSPVVTANIIDDEEPTIQGLYQPSIIVERGGRKIGIIGVIISTTDVNITIARRNSFLIQSKKISPPEKLTEFPF